MTEILKETTQWNDASFHVPNHTYLLDNKGYIIAYVKEGGNEIIKLKGTIRLDKRRRTFAKIKNNELELLLKQTPQKTTTRTFKIISGENEYFVEYDSKRYSCTCTGFTYRGKCKHITAVMEKIK